MMKGSRSMVKKAGTVSDMRGASRAAIETVEMPSRKLASRIAAERGTSSDARAEFSQTLVNDAKSRARVSMGKLARAG